MQLLQTRPLPQIPKNVKMQSDVANYIVDLWNNASECKANMRAIKEVVK